MTIRRSKTLSRGVRSKRSGKGGYPFGVPRCGRLALKVMIQWIRRMKRGAPKQGFKVRKTIEVRSYLPSTPKLLPPGAEPPRTGTRIYIVCDGKVHGCCTLGRTYVYKSIRSFNRDQARHHVTKKTATSQSVSFVKIKEFLASRGTLYGWELRNMRWFEKSNPCGLPQGGTTWRAVRVPQFQGQEYGQVWARNLLPAALEHKLCNYKYDHL